MVILVESEKKMAWGVLVNAGPLEANRHRIATDALEKLLEPNDSGAVTWYFTLAKPKTDTMNDKLKDISGKVFRRLVLRKENVGYFAAGPVGRRLRLSLPAGKYDVYATDFVEGVAERKVGVVDVKKGKDSTIPDVPVFAISAPVEEAADAASGRP